MHELLLQSLHEHKRAYHALSFQFNLELMDAQSFDLPPQFFVLYIVIRPITSPMRLRQCS
jgi:hypothetical protein